MALPPLSILHFNDVYELSSSAKRDPVGGAARFVHALSRVRAAASTFGPTLALFSGDALSPSVMSTITRGKHMIRVLNACRLDASCLGNHDLDFGVENFAAIASQHAFPWIVSNCSAVNDGLPLGGCKEYHVIECGGWKVGLLGLIEQEWLETLATINTRYVAFEPYTDCAKRLVPVLKEKYGCNIIVALTHMRRPNDIKLAASGCGIDLVLGGHDHDYVVRGAHTTETTPECTGVIPLVKSGTDFRQFSLVRCSERGSRVDADEGAAAGLGVHQATLTTPRLSFDVYRTDINRSEPEDPGMVEVVKEYETVLGKKMDSVLGVTYTALDATFTHVRTRETNIGNLLADLMRQAVDAQVAILNSGTLRADGMIGPGIIRMKDLVAMLPMQDPVVKLRMPGSVLLAALENAVSTWPSTEGRFAQVSGIKFSFDPKLPSGSRVIRDSVLVVKQPLEPVGVDTPNAAFKHWLCEVGSAPLTPSTDSDMSPVIAQATSHNHTHYDVVVTPASHSHHHKADNSDRRMRRADSAPSTSSLEVEVLSGEVTTPDVEPEIWEPLVLESFYTVATKAYLAEGKDGFDCFLDSRVEVLVDGEQGPILPTIFRNHFRILAAASGQSAGMNVLSPLSPFQCARSTPRGVKVQSTAFGRGSVGGAEARHAHAHHPSHPPLHAAASLHPQGGATSAVTRSAFAIAPVVEGRVTILGAED